MPPYSKWEWNTHHNAESQSNKNTSTKTTHSINYLSMGDTTKPALLLVHGFGASSYHFRYNIPELAKDYHVYAIDLLGFGWSDKPIMDYDASVWRDQVIEFIDQVIFKEKEDDTRSIAIAGNSLGGYTAMYAASDGRIKDYVRGCILLNSAGRFRPEEGEETPAEPNPIVKSISSAIQRLVIACSFVITKQPARIEQILKSVYPSDSSNVNSELVESIRAPALDPNAAEVFYRVITKNGSGHMAFVDDIIKELECPVLLAWGEKDPWIRPAAADKMQRLHAEFHGENIGGENGSKWMKRVSIDAGHCPHDEAPEAVNKAILRFAAEVF
jgi:pimeloyl-ACP methyl ester carboxylesterase